jgi:hypothetical protein
MLCGRHLGNGFPRAFETGWRLSQEYRLTSVQPSILALGLISDKSSAAARALNITDDDQQAHTAGLIQDDLIGGCLQAARPAEG